MIDLVYFRFIHQMKKMVQHFISFVYMCYISFVLCSSLWRESLEAICIEFVGGWARVGRITGLEIRWYLAE
jgi:hypothetical protein